MLRGLGVICGIESCKVNHSSQLTLLWRYDSLFGKKYLPTAYSKVTRHLFHKLSLLFQLSGLFSPVELQEFPN